MKQLCFINKACNLAVDWDPKQTKTNKAYLNAEYVDVHFSKCIWSDNGRYN